MSSISPRPAQAGLFLGFMKHFKCRQSLDAQSFFRYNYIRIRFCGMWRSLASALALGARGRGFKSLHPDQAPWSSGLRHRPFTAVTRVRIPVGSPNNQRHCLYYPHPDYFLTVGASPSGKAPDSDSGISLVRIQPPQPFNQGH